VAGALLWPKQARPNEWVTFFVKVRLAPGFHIYALDHSGRGTMPSKIIDTPPEALRPQGPWRSTAPKTLEDGSRVLTGEVLFQRRLRLSPAAQPGTNLVAVELQFQICNEAACWPPDKARLKSEFEVLSSKP
jgi:DsbC/DsbD-like thiol-disulfide interchange protein